METHAVLRFGPMFECERVHVNQLKVGKQKIKSKKTTKKAKQNTRTRTRRSHILLNGFLTAGTWNAKERKSVHSKCVLSLLLLLWFEFACVAGRERAIKVNFECMLSKPIRSIQTKKNRQRGNRYDCRFLLFSIIIEFQTIWSFLSVQ